MVCIQGSQSNPNSKRFCLLLSKRASEALLPGSDRVSRPPVFVLRPPLSLVLCRRIQRETKKVLPTPLKKDLRKSHSLKKKPSAKKALDTPTRDAIRKSTRPPKPVPIKASLMNKNLFENVHIFKSVRVSPGATHTPQEGVEEES